MHFGFHALTAFHAHNPNGRRATAKCEKANSHTRNIYRLLIFLMFKTNNFIINDRALHKI